jgi:hypothetical protein
MHIDRGGVFWLVHLKKMPRSALNGRADPLPDPWSFLHTLWDPSMYEYKSKVWIYNEILYLRHFWVFLTVPVSLRRQSNSTLSQQSWSNRPRARPQDLNEVSCPIMPYTMIFFLANQSRHFNNIYTIGYKCTFSTELVRAEGHSFFSWIVYSVMSRGLWLVCVWCKNVIISRRAHRASHLTRYHWNNTQRRRDYPRHSTLNICMRINFYVTT